MLVQVLVLSCTISFILVTTCQPSPLSALTVDNFFPTRQTIAGDGYGGAGYTVLPLLGNEPPATVILVHGLGGTGEEWGFVGLALSFFSLNFVKFVIPTAPRRYVSYLNETLPSWYNIFSLTDFASRINEDQLLESVARVDSIIEGERQRGVAFRRIFVIGFSQGGGVALTTFLRSSRALAGCVAVATWLPLDEDYPKKLSNVIKDKFILFIHGTEDRAVPISYAVHSMNRINDFGKSVNLTSNVTRLVGEQHLLLTADVMTHIETYISNRANGTTRFLVTLVKELTDSFSKLTTDMNLRSLFGRNTTA